MKEKKRGIGLYLILILVIVGVLIYSLIAANSWKNHLMSDQELEEVLAQESSVDEITVIPIRQGDSSMGHAVIVLTDGEQLHYYVSDITEFRNHLKTEHPGIRLFVEAVEEESVWESIIPMVLIMGVMIFIVIILFTRMQGGNMGNMNDFGKSHAERIDKNKNPIRFANVAGLYEEKEQMREIVEFLKDPKHFMNYGARIPKGILLVGPPGTGKTYLAKAVAGEAGVPFFSISGSDFVEMFVGVGAARVRDMFAEAKASAPCIVFIDEIDAVGRHRGAGLGGSHDEREQTLNQLLVEMDGFAFNQGVIVLAATNRVDILDPALLRPGRFDRQIVVNRPDVKEREEMLAVHVKNKPLGSDVDLKLLAQMTAGFTPADLENLLNEAAILAAKDKKGFISSEHIEKSFIKVSVGTEKKTRVISDKEKQITAYHEAGHAIIHHVLPLLDDVHVISIIPTGLAGGYTMPVSEEDSMYLTKGRMKQELVSFLGGRVAEELKMGDITTGASNDIERATAIARDMVTRYGMSETLGPVQYGKDDSEVFLGRELSHTRNYGEQVAGQIDAEVRALMDEAHQEARRILTENDAILEKVHNLLLEKEKLTGEEFNALFNEESDENEKQD